MTDLRTARNFRWHRWLTVCLLLFGSNVCELSGDEKSADEPKTDEAVPLVVTLELPQQKVREYHRPYVAVWIEDVPRELVQHLAVWYQHGENEEGHGEKWLPDLRQWWRRGGRKMDEAVDAVSGPTRTVGTHRIRVTEEQLKSLRPGSYAIVVEASREVGGRELVRLPFMWPVSSAETVRASGKTELGEVSLQFSPKSTK